MKKDNAFKIIISTSLVIVMAVAFMPIFGVSNANAATKKGRLVKSVTKQFYDTGKKKWVTEGKDTYTYNRKGDPVKVKKIGYENGKQNEVVIVKNSFKYTKKSVRKSRKTTWDTDEGFRHNTERWTYDKKGNPKKLNYSYSDEDGRWTGGTHVYTYTKKGWYLKTDGHNWRDNYMDEESEDYTGKDKYTVKQKKYLLKSIVWYWYDDNDNAWKKYNSMSFNSRGLMSKSKRADGSETTTYKYTWKKGRVTTVVVNYKSTEESFRERFKISYTKKKTGKIRYAKMINEILTEGSSYSLYPWY